MLIQLYYTISSVSDIIELSDVVPDIATRICHQLVFWVKSVFMNEPDSTLGRTETHGYVLEINE